MAFLGKAHRIAVLRIVVRRVTVEECVFPVILTDEVDAVLVLDDHLSQPAGALPDQMEKAADVAGFSGEGFCAAAEAVPDELEIVGGSPHISARRPFQHHPSDGFGIRRFQIPLGQLHLLVQIVIGEFLTGEKLIQHIEVITGVQRQKAKLQKERHGSVFDTAEQIGQVAVEIVINLHASLLDRAAQCHCPAAAEHIDKPGIARGGQLMDQPEQLAFASHPGDEAFQAVSPPSRGRDIWPLSVNCSNALVRPRSAWAIFLILLRSCRIVLCSSSSVSA